jgi:hypothetical protein
MNNDRRQIVYAIGLLFLITAAAVAWQVGFLRSSKVRRVLRRSSRQRMEIGITFGQWPRRITVRRR